MLHTTLQRVRQAHACAKRYEIFRVAAQAAGYGDNDPIPLTFALESNGLDDTLWAFQTVMPGEEDERDRIARLVLCDYAERVSSLWISPPRGPWVLTDPILTGITWIDWGVWVLARAAEDPVDKASIGIAARMLRVIEPAAQNIDIWLIQQLRERLEKGI